MSPRTLARALALFLVAASASGCCQALNTFCSCADCLLSGPRLPGAVPQRDEPPLREAKAPAPHAASMGY
ncbi:MAG: hypothetical protein HYS27_07575 [Deltaproteobacteria bacterium]|nr:hypothetical protein [Deltaproteobacteria bacterium]